MASELVLNNVKAYLSDRIVECSLAIDKGRISRIGKEASMPKADTVTDLRGLLVLPGLIDTHVHLRDEGKAFKEDFFTGTASAAAGGFTTVLDMPNNDPVTMSPETLHNRMRIAEPKIVVNVGFFSEFPSDLKAIGKIAKEGNLAFKLFMTEQVGGLNIDDDYILLMAFRMLKDLSILVAVHAEDKADLATAEERLKRAERNDLEAYIEAHSESVELHSVMRLLRIARQAKTQVHFCHITTERGLEEICRAKKSTKLVTCEVTPQNLFLSSRDLRRIGTLAVTMPPVREKRHMDALWNGVTNGCIDTLGSDHAPHKLEEKQAEEIWDVKVGIPGLETTLPLLLTAVKRGRLALTDIVRLMSEEPARIFKLEGRGSLREGNFADLTVVDLGKRCKIDPSRFHTKAKYSPFEGWEVEGMPVKTYVGGEIIMDSGEIVASMGQGKIIRRA